MIDGNELPIAGAAGLGILALAGAGLLLRRRRRDDDEVIGEDDWREPAMKRTAPATSAAPAVVTAPVMTSAPMQNSAFGWPSAPRNETPRETSKPMSRFEAAKRGPTPENPSLSLKKRLKRAAFFDQRDRQVAAGTGTPILGTAGLPGSMVAEASTIAPARTEPVRLPRTGISRSFGKSLEPV